MIFIPQSGPKMVKMDHHGPMSRFPGRRWVSGLLILEENEVPDSLCHGRPYPDLDLRMVPANRPSLEAIMATVRECLTPPEEIEPGQMCRCQWFCTTFVKRAYGYA